MKLPDRDLKYADTPITELEHNVGKQVRYGCRRWDSNPHEVALTGF